MATNANNAKLLSPAPLVLAVAPAPPSPPATTTTTMPPPLAPPPPPPPPPPPLIIVTIVVVAAAVACTVSCASPKSSLWHTVRARVLRYFVAGRAFTTVVVRAVTVVYNAHLLHSVAGCRKGDADSTVNSVARISSWRRRWIRRWLGTVPLRPCGGRWINVLRRLACWTHALSRPASIMRLAAGLPVYVIAGLLLVVANILSGHSTKYTL